MSTLTVAESQIVRGLYDGLDLSGFINWIGEVATEWYPDVDAISVGFPGPVRADGFVYRAPTLLGSDFMGGWWPPMLCTSGRSIPYVIMNDVSAAAKGVLGDGTETNSAVINMGSGLGVKVFVKGQERSGPNGRGGELGHWRVTNDDRFVCDCGGRGHLGAVASGRGAEQLALLMGYPSSAENIAAEFVAGEDWAEIIVDRICSYLARGLSAIWCSIGIEDFVFVGGFAVALGERFLDLLAGKMGGTSWDLGIDWRSGFHLAGTEGRLALIGAGRIACGWLDIRVQE